MGHSTQIISGISILLSAIAIAVAYNVSKRYHQLLNSAHGADVAAMMLQIRLDIIAVELVMAHALNAEKNLNTIDVKWLERKLSEIRRQYDLLRGNDDSMHEGNNYLLDLET